MANSRIRFLIPRLPVEQVTQLRAIAADVEVAVADSQEEALEHAPDMHAAYGFISPEIVCAGPRLRWLQAGSAGIEGYLFPELVEREIILTNARGVYASHLAEHHLAFIFAFSRNLHVLRHRQQEEVWESRANLVPHELAGETLLVVGLGGTGMDTAWRAHALGMRVIGVTSTLRPFPGFIEKAGGRERLHEYLGEADYVAICCAHTRETYRMFSDPEFAAMKPAAYLSNVTRGGIVDTEALVRALEQRQIAGAGLDVTDPEPLPRGHPLWHMETVILTPHSSGHSPHADRRMFDLLRENLRRFARDEPLLNVVDKHRGF
jgi:phosphoglycerate dehydrogenase-like enzyme